MIRKLLFCLILVICESTIAQQISSDADWQIKKVPEDQVICFALYTVNNNILKLTAQFYELDGDADRTAHLQIKRDGQWTEIAKTKIIERGWTAPFRVENWDSSKDYEYRVAHGRRAFFNGTIRRNPVDKEEIVVAAFTGNSNKYRGPRPDVIANIKVQDPDLLFFSGDQVYDHTTHFASWLLFGRQFRDIMKDRPTICIPDDHDVGNGNLWGGGGRIGYLGYNDPEYVKEVERAQTSHLPDPYDSAPIERGIGVYYTSLNWGRIGFAIIEDRKFKSQVDILDSTALEEKGVVFSREDHIEKFSDPALIDVPGAKMLSDRQLAFLQEWGADWNGTDMKAVLSQTVFCGGAHIHRGQRLKADLDSNGWPQSGRNRALDVMRRCFALHIAGDQHLATIIHHGIDEWNDAGWSFCVPSILNFYPRKWLPEEKGLDPIPGPLADTGKYFDGFGNRITMYAYVNPAPENMYPPADNGASGYGLVRFNKVTRQITMECWPRGVDVSKPDARQYTGFPVTINQEDNYGRRAAAYLPTIEVVGRKNPVIQIIDETNKKIVYTIRINGMTFRPKVFKKGRYTIKIDGGDIIKVLRNVDSLDGAQSKTITVQFEC
ncbi:metallophosphoesterase [candidate division KSB1 bacterium]|nr:metallophosphoesterase [candidate division KSB1 bacterium]